MLSHHRLASEMSFEWGFSGGPMMACFWLYVVFGSNHSLKKRKKNDGPPLKNVSKSAHVSRLLHVFVNIID